MPFLCPIKGHQRGSDDGCVISLILTKKCGHDSPPLEVMSTLGTCILSTLPSVSTFFALPILVYDVSILRMREATNLICSIEEASRILEQHSHLFFYFCMGAVVYLMRVLI